ncbi:MAG: DMT family transporter, partial [Blastocatellia bacterium]
GREAAFGATDLWLLLLTLVWGVNYVVIKHALEDLIPINFTALRLAIASVVMVAVTRLSGRDFRIDRKDLPKIFAIGILANVIYQALFISGMSMSRAGNASLILASSPLFTAMIGRLRKTELFSAGSVIGLLMAFGGLALIVTLGHTNNEGSDSILGDGLLLVGASCWAGYTVATKGLVHRYGAIKATTLVMLAGTPILMLVSAPSLYHQNWRGIRPVSWGGLAFSACFAIAFAYIVWSHGIQKIGSTRTSVYSNIIPISTLLIAWPTLGEVPLPGQIAGGIVVITGLYLVRHGVRHRPGAEGSPIQPAVPEAQKADLDADAVSTLPPE